MHLNLVNQGKLATLCTPSAARLPGGYVYPGILPSHAYTVLGTQEWDGQRSVHICNPWGNTKPDGRGAVNSNGDGSFWFSLSDVPRAFNTLSIGG